MLLPENGTGNYLLFGFVRRLPEGVKNILRAFHRRLCMFKLPVPLVLAYRCSFRGANKNRISPLWRDPREPMMEHSKHVHRFRD